jgi:hypothetical protein
MRTAGLRKRCRQEQGYVLRIGLAKRTGQQLPPVAAAEHQEERVLKCHQPSTAWGRGLARGKEDL